jgi:ABC-type transport system involved in multi-copper enzyme maturation permease subunit
MLRSPGTLTILRALSPGYHASPYARQLRRYRHRVPWPPRVQGVINALPAIGCMGLFLLCSGLAVMNRPQGQGPVFVVTINPTQDQVVYTLLCVALGVFWLPAIGAALIAGRISRVIGQERARHTLDYLLMLPHDRNEVLLHAAGRAYAPLPFIIGLGFIELAALGLAPLPGVRVGWPSLALLGMLLVEWLQLGALSVAVGILAGSARLGLGLAALYAVLMVLSRAALGWIAAGAAGLAGNARVLALIVGPWSGSVSRDGWPVGIALGALYLLALEALVRGVFAWSAARAGES